MNGTTGQIVYANPAIAALCGLPVEHLVGRPISELLKLPAKSDCALCLGTGESWATVHGGILSQDHEEIRIKIKHSPLPNHQVLCLIDPFSEDTVLTQAHNDFVSTVSHEFRTPLTSIKGFADTLLNYGGQLPEDEKRRFINIIKDQAERLIRLVENLLTVSKLGASRMEMSFRPIPLKRLLDKVTQSVQAKHKHERVFQISVIPDAIEAWADPDRLEQVLINLIDNAVKYSPAHTPIAVKAELLSENEEQIRIQVIDQGAGIPQELLPKLFSKFYRVEGPMTSEVEGTGLGLYITKSLTNAMGGEITVDSTPNKGSTFTLTLPAATPERQAIHRRRLAAEDSP